MFYNKPKVFKFLDGRPRVFKISMCILRRQPFSNGSNIKIPYTNMNIMVDGGGSNSAIGDQQGKLLAMATILAN